MGGWSEALHPRDTEGRFAEADGWARRVANGGRAPHVSEVPPAEPAAAAEGFWADDAPDPVDAEFDRMRQEMRDWRALGEPEAPPVDVARMEALGFATDPESVAAHQRLRAYREAGYTGPLDQDNQIPDPDDPANHEWLHAGAALSLTHDRG